MCLGTYASFIAATTKTGGYIDNVIVDKQMPHKGSNIHWNTLKCQWNGIKRQFMHRILNGMHVLARW